MYCGYVFFKGNKFHSLYVCVNDLNQWSACKKVEHHLKNHFYYKEAEITEISLNLVVEAQTFRSLELDVLLIP